MEYDNMENPMRKIQKRLSENVKKFDFEKFSYQETLQNIIRVKHSLIDNEQAIWLQIPGLVGDYENSLMLDIITIIGYECILPSIYLYLEYEFRKEYEDRFEEDW